MKTYMEMSFLSLLLSSGIFIITVSTARAGSEPFFWDFVNVAIDVQENGDMLITETQKYVFSKAYRTERDRCIPMHKVDDIDSVQVFEEGEPVSAKTRVINGRLWIKWNHPLNPPESHTFVLKYRVKGGLYIDDSGDSVLWKAIFETHSAFIRNGKVTVRLPEMLAGKILSFDASSGSRPDDYQTDKHQTDGRTVEFTSRGSLVPKEGLDVRVTFFHGILDVLPSDWQLRHEGKELERKKREEEDHSGLGLLFLFLLPLAAEIIRLLGPRD